MMRGLFFNCVPKCGENSLPNICTPGSGIDIDCSRERPLPSDFPPQGHEALPCESHKAGGDKKPAPFGSENLPKWSILQLKYGNYLQLFPEYHAWLSILLKCTTVVSRSRASQKRGASFDRLRYNVVGWELSIPAASGFENRDYFWDTKKWWL